MRSRRSKEKALPASRARRAPRPPASSYLLFYRAVRRVPRGKVATYGQIANAAGLPGNARRVGYALYALPAGSGVPWHRVVNAAGVLSVGRLDPDSAREQRLRLEMEGVRFDARGRVVLGRHGWKGGRRAAD
jgi:methylated-DNA-protein-cysteine methyltransferase-like protein